ncbi:GMC oxidoreductase [Amycolatopsis anabasis]|uniref:GMC oxidoreductase n=1 Tax=Amycolatopsis anabasis TaxID=1840409 RepID=UPI00131C9075|nr:GMC family oxidoreductase [Amycolatopsis anabasis]
MTRKAIVIGSGAGGSIAAMTLAEAGWEVTVYEKGPNYFTNLEGPGPVGTAFSNDEVKSKFRNFNTPDPLIYPQTFRSSEAEPVAHVGMVSALPQLVGGGTMHWDAKVPRFWDIDFQALSADGPVPGADVQDWPFDYAELAPYYDEVEALLGVQGDADALSEVSKKHAPRAKPYAMGPGPQQHASLITAEGARKIDLHPSPIPAAINSRARDARPACNNCGFCAGYGCTTQARGSALDPLRRALRTGRVDLVPDTMITKVVLRGNRAWGVEWARPTPHGLKRGKQGADVVVMAASAMETVRLALLSGLPNASGRMGQRLMLHSVLDWWGIFPGERLHTHRGRSATQFLEDFNDPDFGDVRDFAKQNGLPYVRGGMVELGLGSDPIIEANTYRAHLKTLRPGKPFGADFKRMMRASLLRDRFVRIAMVGTDLPYRTNTVTLDPEVKDVHGLPVARITYAVGKHENLAQEYYLPWLAYLLEQAGAEFSTRTGRTSVVPDSIHILGGMHLGADPRTSVCDPYGRVHGTDNVFVTDGSTAVTSGGHNPTLTLMSVALRSMRHLVT